MTIKDNLIEIKNELPPTTKLVAVSKFKPIELVMEAYASGHRAFGESRPQELKEKAVQMPKDIQWHFIGHLQTNKIKMVVPYASLIHSVDSEKLLLEIEKYCRNNDLRAEVLLELHIAKEETKQGFSEEELFSLLSSVNENDSLERTQIRGLMSMASFTEDTEVINKEFTYCKSIFDRVKSLNYTFLDRFDQLSLGMSSDYKLALDYGSTIVRVGTYIFGGRV